MQLTPGGESTTWVIAQLVLIATGVAFILYVALPLPNSRLFGGFFLAIGALHVLFYKTTGRKFFAKTQSSPLSLPAFGRTAVRGEPSFYFLEWESFSP